MGSTGEPRWLDAEEMEAWLALVSVLHTLPQALDANLQCEAAMTLYDYLVLAALSEVPDRKLRLSDLAMVTNGSLPRLSQVVKKLERRRWLEREVDPNDRRITLAVLTRSGMKTLERSAPAHVERVRQLVFDQLTKTQVRQLRDISREIRKTIGPGYGKLLQITEAARPDMSDTSRRRP
jgi:DNA-binding MarR family transcriptional regulator